MKLTYAYMIDREANIALDEDKCETIRMIFESYLSGLSLARLSEMLEKRKLLHRQEKQGGLRQC